MKSGGKTAEVKIGRQILCKEKPSTRATSTCSKQVIKTIKVAKRGLTAQQQALWRKYVYVAALLQVQRFCVNHRYLTNMMAEPQPKRLTLPQMFNKCIGEVLTGKLKFKGLFGKKFKWSDFLINGAKMIKKLPKLPPNAWEQ
jgi:hypothetical protein